MIKNFVKQITIPTPFPVGDVHSWLLKDEKIVLIDCGHYHKTAKDRIESGLKENGLMFQDVDEIWITHAHVDHYGLAAWLQKKTGAVVRASALEKQALAGNSNRRLFAETFEKLSVPRPVIDGMAKQLEWLMQFQQPVTVDDWLEDGNTITSGRNSFTVKHLPGHAPGHIAFVQNGGAIISGDVLLANISTNAVLSFDPETGLRNSSFLQYRESLKWFENAIGKVYPGHGDEIENPGALASDYLSQHDRRLKKILGKMNSRPKSITDIGAEIFPDAVKKGAWFLVISEILGFMDWGMELGLIEEVQFNSEIKFVANQTEIEKV